MVSRAQTCRFGICLSLHTRFQSNQKCIKWEKALESKRLKANINKTKAIKVGAKEVASDTVDPCQICEKRVMKNLIQSQK